MKKMFAFVALAVLALTGCGVGTQATGDTSASPTMTPSPTPTVMSTAEAGKVYLDAVCPSNILSDKLSKTAQIEPVDIQAIRADAAALRDGFRKTIETLSDEKVLWPETVRPDVAALAEDMYLDLSGAENVANQATEADLIAAWNTWNNGAQRAPIAQKIRLKLGLVSDTTSSCTPS